MSNAAILYLRLLRRIVRESACRLGGAEESFLAAGFSASDAPASPQPVGRDGRRTHTVGHDKQRTHTVGHDKQRTQPVVCGGAVERDNRARS